MSTRRHKKHAGGGHEEEGSSERWTTSYMDMVTVLMCLFIVLYAMSTFDKDKFEKLRLALSTGFGVTKSHTVDTATGVVVPKEDVGKKGVDAAQQSSSNTSAVSKAAAAAAVTETEKLQDLEKQISASLAAQGLSANVSYSIDSRGLTVGLVGSQTFFSGNSDVLQPVTKRVLNAIGPVLRALPNQVAVEGHADGHSNPYPFASDWDLAAGRSTAVLKYLVTVNGVPQGQIYSASYGAARPIQPNMVPSQYALNRRVDIVVLSTASEDVRDLIPAEVKAGK
jgi:chemotaxis protein MotB